MTLTVRNKLLLNAAFAAVATIAVGFAGWAGIAHLESAADRLIEDSRALRQQMYTDMRHDTLRADVYSALFQGSLREEERRGHIVKETRIHGEEMMRALGEARRLAPPKVKPLMTEAETPLKSYVALADELAALAMEDPSKASARVPEFDAAFDALEVQLGKISDGIEATSREAQADAMHTVSLVTRAIAAVALVATVLLLLGSFVIARGVLGPLRRAVAASAAVAAGDLTARLESDRKDEIGALLSALEKMRSDLSVAVGDIQAAALNVRTGSREIARGNADLSSRTEEQASSLEETSSSMAQITEAVKQNTDSARQASSLANGASSVAALGGEAVRHAVVTMEGLTEASRRIAEITAVIDGIAFQTNILALNAAVEAARAGEQGRGFAVVATEVRALSQRCSAAAKEIKGLIEDSVQRVDEGARQVGGAGERMEEIMASVQRVSTLVAEIANASEEQLRGIEHVSRAVTQMDEVVQQNAALVEESAAAAENLAAQAELMASTAGRFKLEGAGDAGAANDAALPVAPRLAGSPTLRALPRASDTPLRVR